MSVNPDIARYLANAPSVTVKDSSKIAGVTILSLLIAGVVAVMIWWVVELVSKTKPKKNSVFNSRNYVPPRIVANVPSAQSCVSQCIASDACGGMTYDPKTKVCQLKACPGTLSTTAANTEAWAK